MADTRLAGADFVRAAACLMVVAHHIAQRIAPGALPLSGARAVQWVMMGAFGVGAFFVLSGYLLARPFWIALDRGEPMPSLRTYALRRAARILPGYWLSLTVTFLLSFLLLRFPFDGELLFRYLSGLLLVADFHWLTFFPVEYNGPLWSICCEITSYALLPIGIVLIFALPLKGWVSRLAFVLLIAAVLAVNSQIVKYLIPDGVRSWDLGLVGGAKVWLPNYNPLGFFAIFALGALAAGIQTRFMQWRSIIFDLVVLGGFALIAWSIYQNYPHTDGFGLTSIPYGYPWFPLGVALILIGTPSAMLIPKLTENVVIAFLARISFGIYVWHFLMLECVRVLYRHDYVFGSMSSVSLWAWLSAGVVAAAVAIATLSYYLLEAPIIHWARTFEHRPIANAPTLSPAAG